MHLQTPWPITYRDDITCPKSDEKIPLDKMSISKWSETRYYVYCPDCRVFHAFDVEAK